MRASAICLVVDYEVRVVSCLTEANKDVKNVCVVIEHRSMFYIRVELRFGLCVQGLVEVVLKLIHVVFSDTHNTRWKLNIVCAVLFGSPKEQFIEHLWGNRERRMDN